jgi:hypothetical protein
VPSLFQRLVELGVARSGMVDTVRAFNERAKARTKA